MDFFAQQDKARRQTRLLIFLFLLAVIAIVAAVDMVVLTLVANLDANNGQTAAAVLPRAGENIGLLTLTSLGTAGLIGLASLFRIAGLSAGGGKVARSLGGTQVAADTQDPLRRRLHNVVEEMAIASGVPVPEIYVLEQEQGLNAFAAGFTPSDAAIAVTRGSLETFSRNELQGVIAHEFSHILNGDMRLNMRLMGMLFGILVISIIGRTILRNMRQTRFRSSRSKDNGGGIAAVMLIGLALAVIGYLGLFCARLIKAGVSRQREYLADASAVQFTRQTDGIAGALKKIGYGASSIIVDSDGEEVSHMLFANGLRSYLNLYATHPPIEQRISALEADFDAEFYLRDAVKQVADRERASENQDGAKEESDAQARLNRLMQAALILTPGAVSDSIGNPRDTHIQHAAELRRLIPPQIYRATRSAGGAPLLMLALLLDPDKTIRQRQLKQISASFAPERLSLIEQIHATLIELGPQFRLPLMELAFPALKQRPREQIDTLVDLINTLIETDGHVDTFEYLLSRALWSLLKDAQRPQRVTTKLRTRLASSVSELHTLFSVVARLGHREDHDAARDAYQIGMLALLPSSVEWPSYDPPQEWTLRMDQALDILDSLPPMIKEELVKALTVTISHDGRITASEAELLRAVCIILHCPLPPFVLDTVAEL